MYFLFFGISFFYIPILRFAEIITQKLDWPTSQNGSVRPAVVHVTSNRVHAQNGQLYLVEPHLSSNTIIRCFGMYLLINKLHLRDDCFYLNFSWQECSCQNTSQKW
jgi:hypothetical protein